MAKRKNKKAFNFTGDIVRHIRHLHDHLGMKPREIERAFEGLITEKQIRNQLADTIPICTRKLRIVTTADWDYRRDNILGLLK